MIQTTSRDARQALAAVITLMLAACGGGTREAAPMDAPEAALLGNKVVKSTTLNAERPATVLTVRAHGVLAGDEGPKVQLRIDGVVVDTIEVRATEPTDYPIAVPPMRPGTKVDLVYMNDATPNGGDRNLIVSQLTAGGTFLLPSSPGVTLDWGLGDAAFDGVNVVAGQAHVWANGALRMTWPEPNLTDRVTVRASGMLAGNVGPMMSVRVDGVLVGSTEVRSTKPADYSFAVPVLKPGSRVDVVYTNDEAIDGEDRNLNVAYLLAGTTVLLPNSNGVTYDLGSGLAALDGANVQAGQGHLASNGALRARWPTANMTDTLTVRASGKLAGNVGPIMQVQVDGVVLGAVEVRAATPTDFSFATLPMAPGKKVDVFFTNPGSADGVARSLVLAYAMAGKTYLQASNNSLHSTWPSPNLTDTLTVRARGSLAGNAGPIMQVLVDGVMVGNTEVRSTEFSDFSFAAPAMQPGRKVQVVFTNDALINGADRNLHVSYLISGSTYLLPNAPGNTFDRGSGQAAFDGADLIAATGSMMWNGALNGNWPAANITNTVTVRASATPAGNVGALMQLWVDGVAVSSVEVRSTSPTDYAMPTPALKPGSQVEVRFANPETVAGIQRQLNLAYLIAGNTVLLPTSAGATLNAGNLRASWPAPNLTDTVTVRAHGVLAGDEGPKVQLRIDGVVVDTIEVRATEPTDYPIAVPPMRPGTKVDLVYMNDATPNGGDRNLIVSQLTAGGTFLLPSSPGVTLDWGLGDAAFDGVNVVAGQAHVWANGALRMTWPEPNLTDRVTVRASGMLAGNVGPMMSVRVDGVLVGSTEVRSTKPADYSFAVPVLKPGSRVDVVYTNDEVIDGEDRNLNVAYLLAGTTVLLPNSNGVTYDLGSGLAALDGANVQAGQGHLASNGALRARWPTANMTDTLTVRASGKLAGNVGPIMQVQVDGVVLGAVEVRAATPTDFSFATLPMAPGKKVDVFFTNPGSADGVARSLVLAYAMAGKTYLQASNNSLHSTWPSPNLTDTLTVRARGSLAGNAGPIMQVLVDGVMVGNTEVRSTEFSDFSFAAPAMQPGRKVQVVFTNDALINGADRNLHVSYLISGSTYLLPNAPGNTFDRGSGQAAFDGADLIAATGSMMWNGALNGNWPAANITNTVTVRASATPAGNVGALMQLWVDGVAVSSVEVRSTSPTDYAMPTPALKPGSQVEVRFANPETVAGIQRQLNLAYLIAGNTVLLPTSAGATLNAGNLRASWPAPNLTDTVTVRAHGVLAGDEGPKVQLRIDGVVVDTIEVRATEPTDYPIAVPPMRPGTKVDLVYMNDATPNGGDRNLIVSQLTAGGTFLLPSSPGVTLDWGLGDAAFDGVNVVAGQAHVWANGALRMTWPEPNLTDRVTVRASGMLAGNVGPMMSVRVDGVLVGSTEVRSTKPADYSFAVPVLKPGSRVDVVYTNDEVIDGEDRNLNVAYLLAGTTVLLPNSNGVTYDLGSGLAALDGANVQAGQGHLASNGALRARWPTANMTDTLTVRASGKLAGNVGPIMQVQVDGVVLGAVEVRAATPTDFSFATLPMAPGKKVDVFFTNPGSADGVARSLVLAYAMAGKTYLQASNNSLHSTWPSPNLTDTLTVRARGSLAGNAGPIMQVLVDGVMVGNTEVRSTEFSDFSFAAPAMQPGRKVQVVFTNDALINGADRNLHVSYLISGSTYLLPNAPGNTFDRGSGQAAFDGADLIAATGSMMWNGALNGNWPAANITNTVTVRASATPAGNVGALMQLWVDGVAVSSVEVRSTSPTDYAMPTPALKPGSQVEVRFANPETVAGIQRQLNLAYLIAGNTVLLPTSAGTTSNAGNLRASWPAPNLTDTVTVRAYASLAGNIGALMQLRVDGVITGTVEVRATTPTNYTFPSSRLNAGSKIDVAFINDQVVNGQDRNLYVQSVRTPSGLTLAATASNVQVDVGIGEAAFDGLSTTAANGALTVSGAMRFSMPAVPVSDVSPTALYNASRFLRQASFGPSWPEVNRLARMSMDNWIAEQVAMPSTSNLVKAIQARYDLGEVYHPPMGTQYTPNWVMHSFWTTAATAPDQLRMRMGYALHQIFMVSQADSNLLYHARAYANYLDTLNRHALGNFRTLLEEMALSPVMGIYLSHMRNRPENLTTGRMPDENFAREVMQLFTIGLHELNIDGTLKRDAQGNPIETYTNDDVMALAKVFTGWGWALPDNMLSENNFLKGKPDLRATGNQRVDLLRMKNYPGMHSTAEKRLFMGKQNALLIPAYSTAPESLRLALDTLFNHPNVGPFIGRQLIQRLVTSHPSPAYVARVATAFNNNGKGMRGDLAAVVRAILLDPEAVSPPAGSMGKLREPVLRVTQWMRGFETISTTSQNAMVGDLDALSQRVLAAPSVFGYYRPGYVPPNTSLSRNSITVPEFEIVTESTAIAWVNTAQKMASTGLGWTGSGSDVVANLQPLVDLLTAGNIDAMIERLNVLLFAGRMSAGLKQDLLEATINIGGNSVASQTNRARVALFLSLASTEYLVEH